MVYWTVVCYVIIPFGLVLCLMHLSNHAMLLSWSSSISKMEIKLSFGKYGTLRLPFSLFIAAFACISAIAQFSQSQHYTHLVSNVDLRNTPTQVNDRYRSMYFRAQRNLWISILWLLTWLSCWRLSDLKTKHALTAYTPPPANVPGGMVNKLLGMSSVVLVVILAAVADLPLARLNYNFSVYQNISPEKAQLQEMMSNDCQASYFASAEGPCREFCQQVRFLAEERQRIVHWVRSWHLTGTVAAQIFDGVRGVEQNGDKLSELFNQKTCTQILTSVDKTNTMVNAGCWIAAVICVFLAFALLFGRGEDKSPVPIQAVPQEVKKDI